MQQVTGTHLKALAADIHTAGHYIYSLSQGNPLDQNVELGEILIQLAHLVTQIGDNYERSPHDQSNVKSIQKLLASELFTTYPQTLDTFRAQNARREYRHG
jgi:hypothetical protein